VTARKVIIPVEFEIGTLEQIGYGGFKVTWVSSETDDGTEYDLTAGAGVGSDLIEASVKRGDVYVWAKASVRPLTTELWNQMRTDLNRLIEEGGR
jgi:hypothetical protein